MTFKKSTFIPHIFLDKDKNKSFDKYFMFFSDEINSTWNLDFRCFTYIKKLFVFLSQSGKNLQ